ncbi:MAG: biotin--[acetyl-CoA-carboxylase] ligase [Magnetococcales bacterium]|nr:biotin--[acetyl-CoA-carboxylase] ligase [Magnetococcales bacterium]
MADDSEGLTREAMTPHLSGRLFAAERYHFHPRLDSTNQQALSMGQSGAPEGTLVVADAQTRGRGRLGRSWCSPAGENLYFSMLLRPPLPVHQAPRLTLVAGLATLEALRSAGVPGVLKWPNDVLVSGRKLAGILTEMATEGERIRHVVVGIGVNVNGTAQAFPPEVASRAVTMADILQRKLHRQELLTALLAAWEHWYDCFLTDGFEPVRMAWRSQALLEGQRVRIETSSETLDAWLEDLDGDGFLLARTTDGERFRVLAGDVVLI